MSIPSYVKEAKGRKKETLTLGLIKTKESKTEGRGLCKNIIAYKKLPLSPAIL